MKEFMQLALQSAHEAAQKGEVPVGAVIVKDGRVLAKAYNNVETQNDPTAHAEILVLKLAGNILQTPILNTCDLYVSLEPCAMCAYAIVLSRIRRLYFAAYDEKRGAIMNGPKILGSKVCHHKVEVYDGIMANEAEMLLKNFFQKIRYLKK